MLTLERQEEILDILNKTNSATVEELAAKLFVSGATIRRDLRQMESQGLISLNCSVLPTGSRPNRTMTSADF